MSRIGYPAVTSTNLQIEYPSLLQAMQKKHIDKLKQDGDVTKWKSLLNKQQRKLFTVKIVQKEGGAYTPLYYHDLGWYKKNVISTNNILH